MITRLSAFSEVRRLQTPFLVTLPKPNEFKEIHSETMPEGVVFQNSGKVLEKFINFVDVEQTAKKNGEISLRTKILKENQKAHDWFAGLHDYVCSYISRKSCQQFYSNLIRNNLHRPQMKNVLELGCGTGTWASLFSKADHFVGVDISEKMIQIARKKHPESHFRFESKDVKSFLQDEIAKGMKYDVIISSSFLHHLYDIDEILLLVSKVLKKEGAYLAIHEPRISLDSSVSRSLGLKVDSFFSFLLGYDCDLAAHPLWKRILISIKKCIPFKKTLKRILGKRTTSNVSSGIDFNHVDYQLSTDKIFHPIIFTNKIYPELEIKFDFYTYYTFPLLRKVFGDSLNYFWVRFEKK